MPADTPPDSPTVGPRAPRQPDTVSSMRGPRAASTPSAAGTGRGADLPPTAPPASGRRLRLTGWRLPVRLPARLSAFAVLAVLLSHGAVAMVVALSGWPASPLGSIGLSLAAGLVAVTVTLRSAGRWIGGRVEQITIALERARLGDASVRIEAGAADEIGIMARRVSRLIETSSSRERRILESALCDPMTGLANRRLLDERLRRSIALSLRSRAPFCVAVADLDRLKTINDTLGHDAGDLVICEVARRLRGAVRDIDTVARVGGDEFVLVLDGGEDTAHEVTRRIMEKMLPPLPYEGRTIDIGVSIGVAVHPQHGADDVTLLRHADLAMYRAKRQRAGVIFFDSTVHEVQRNDLSLMRELRTAIKGGQLALDYQPKVDLTSGLIVGFEGLLRWNHPSRGRLLPSEFLALAEQTIAMREITVWVIGQGAAFAAMLADRGFALNVAVNVSPKDLEQPDFADQVDEIVRDRGLGPGRLTLEIAEGEILSGTGTVLSNLNALAEKGVRLAIDDFGTGYTLMSQLQQLPVHELKIDRSFVTGMTDSRGHQMVVRSVVGLAKQLGLRTIAEGAETGAELRALAAIGCHEAQGYVIAQPMRAEEVVSWIEMRHALYTNSRETYFRSLLGQH